MGTRSERQPINIIEQASVGEIPSPFQIPEGTARGKLLDMRQAARPSQSRVEMLVVFNDTQLFRQCDQEAFGAFMQFIDHYKDRITHLVANGDITDYELQSKFAKSPSSYGEAYEEIESTRWVFRTLAEKLPHAEKVMIDGNHDDRWKNMIDNQTMGLEEWVRSPEEMFHFKELGWRHIPYGRGNYYQWHDRLFYHGSRAASKGNNAKGELDDAHMSTTTAHTNRNEFWQQRDAMGRVMTSFTHGGFSKDNLGFVKKANTGWNQGFGVYFWSKQTGESVYPVMMKHGNPSFLWEGTLFNGKGFEIPTDGRRKRAGK